MTALCPVNLRIDGLVYDEQDNSIAKKESCDRIVAVSYTHLYEQKIKLLTDKFMPPRDEDEHLRMQKRKEMEQYADYRNYCLLYTSRCV